MLRVQIFQLYGNLLTDEARQPWEKIVKVQTNTIPWEDLRGEVHEEKAGKTWTSFLECVTFHLQSVFHPDAAETVKFSMRSYCLCHLTGHICNRCIMRSVS